VPATQQQDHLEVWRTTATCLHNSAELTQRMHGRRPGRFISLTRHATLTVVASRVSPRPSCPVDSERLGDHGRGTPHSRHRRGLSARTCPFSRTQSTGRAPGARACSRTASRIEPPRRSRDNSLMQRSFTKTSCRRGAPSVRQLSAVQHQELGTNAAGPRRSASSSCARR